MRTTKKYLIKSINFGHKGNPARTLIEKYIEKFGEQKTSEYLRHLVICDMSNKKEFQNWKIERLKYDFMQIKKIIGKRMQQKIKIAEKLENLGINPEEI